MRRLRPTGITGIAVFVLLATTAAGTAIAYFTTTGTGSSSAKTISALAQPTIATATPEAGGTVILTWGAVTAPGNGAVTYKVQRDGGGASGTCTSTLSKTSCVDAGLSVGIYTYVVTAKWRSWTVSSASKAAIVTIGPTDHFVLSAASSTSTAGATDNLTITAKDAGGGTVTTYVGPKSLTFTGASASPGGNAPTVSDSSGVDVAFGTPTSIDFSAGVAAVSAGKNGAMKLYKIGSTTIKAGDGTFTTANVTLTVATTASKFLLAAATTTPVAAAADILTITAKDSYENTVTTYTGAKSLTFSGSSASPSGALPTVADSSSSPINFGSATAITFTSGVAIATSTKNGAMKLNRAGAASITVSDGTISNPTPLAVTVSAGAAARWGIININVSSGTLGSNCLFTCTLTGLGNSGTVTAKVAVTDSVGNTVNAVGTGHAVKVATSGSGAVVGTPLAIPATGAAETATAFTFTSKSAGNFTETVTASFSTGTAYTAATLTASR